MSERKKLSKRQLIKELYNSKKLHARQIGHDFKLYVYEFSKLIRSNCFYCDKHPNNVFKFKRKNFTLYLTYQGIDRKNNNRGYIRGNVISCCFICNNKKRQIKFKDYLKKINKNI